MWSTRYSCQILMKPEFSPQVFEKSSTIKFHENPSSGVKMFGEDGRTDRQFSKHAYNHHKCLYCTPMDVQASVTHSHKILWLQFKPLQHCFLHITVWTHMAFEGCLSGPKDRKTHAINTRMYAVFMSTSNNVAISRPWTLVHTGTAILVQQDNSFSESTVCPCYQCTDFKSSDSTHCVITQFVVLKRGSPSVPSAPVWMDSPPGAPI
jgi:hypothetical protein